MKKIIQLMTFIFLLPAILTANETDTDRKGNSINAANWKMFEEAVSSAEALLLNSIEGDAEGQYPAGSKDILQLVVDSAKIFRTNTAADQAAVNIFTSHIINSCVDFEVSVNATLPDLVDKKATKETRYLYLNLLRLNTQALLFGIQDATGAGVGWTGNNDRSDIKDVCGDLPAVFSEDINTIDRNGDLSSKRYRLKNAYKEGSIVTICWHQLDPDNRGFYIEDVDNEDIVKTILPGGTRHNEYKLKLSKLADFFKTLRGDKGESIPVVFRPYHEHTGGWFWWGTTTTSTAEYNSIWQFTVKYLRDSLNVHNLLWSISPSFQHIINENSYFNVYPGDDYVDIFGGDHYFGDAVTAQDKSDFKGLVDIVASNSLSRSKIPALTEVGQENLYTQNWFTDVILNPLKNDSLSSTMSYVAVWRNANAEHFYAPYPGHPSVPDFLKFYDDPFTYFQRDLPDLYSYPAEDKTPPVLLASTDSIFVFSSEHFEIQVETNERAYVKFSFADETYESMPYSFKSGEGWFTHTVELDGIHGEQKTVYISSSDIYGNISPQAVPYTFRIDTLQQIIAWHNPVYPDKSWLTAPTPIGTGTTAVTKIGAVQTAYFRKKIILEKEPDAFAIMLKFKGGAGLYINNNEVRRINLPLNMELEYNTNPSSNVQENRILVLDSIALSYFKIGENLLAVEIHSAINNTVDNFDSRAFDLNGDVYRLGSEWSYSADGLEPVEIKLADIVSVDYNPEIPQVFSLYQNYPNPFNPVTTIRYDIPEATKVRLEVFNLLGQRVSLLVDGIESAGKHELKFNGEQLSSGIYTVSMQTENYKSARKMVLIK